MPRPTSRLERQERQKILKQTFVFIGAAILVGVVFIFLIIPNFIRILNAVFSGGDAFTVEDTLPPQVPILGAPVAATSSAVLKLSGFAEAESEVIVLLNAQETAITTADSSGEFSTDITLSAGQNTIAAYSRDAAGNESSVGQQFTTLMDSEPPLLEVATPVPSARVEGQRNQSTPVSGKTDPGSKVYVNDRIIFPRTDGTFSSSFFLAEGENKLLFRAVDEAGNERTEERTVLFVR